ncbi:2-iminobutanoate/2-iminopropanoate deaminase [Folsomia candida]|uniref:2-iminobutanoate/2-iminopropanoate deaminase n=1 Tax=Folsomia candida TaxID=158441 RepID=UPI000B8FF7AF|nr:2-iminobutanoate/2-iminopropanoate deaminase [Folsomia candida]
MNTFSTMNLLLCIGFAFCLSIELCQGQYTVRKIIHSDLAPGTTLPLSQAVQVDNMIYVSGNLGMDVNGTLLTGIVNQTRQAFDNIGFILGEAQSSFRHIVKVTVLLSDLNNYDAMNVVYAEYFQNNFPARAAYQVGRLPRDALVEIEVVAISGEIIDITP